MKVRFKKIHPNAVIPTKAHAADAGFDLVATSREEDMYGNISYGLGIAIEIPKGHAGFIFPRSSNCKKQLLMCNSVGVVDCGYTGEIMAKFKPTSIDPYSMDYNVGDKVAQLVIMPYPEIEFEEVDELPESERGANGHGSTGK